jgi:hypothetical protein
MLHYFYDSFSVFSERKMQVLASAVFIDGFCGQKSETACIVVIEIDSSTHDRVARGLATSSSYYDVHTTCTYDSKRAIC